MKQLRDHETKQSYRNQKKLDKNDEKNEDKKKLLKTQQRIHN